MQDELGGFIIKGRLDELRKSKRFAIGFALLLVVSIIVSGCTGNNGPNNPDSVVNEGNEPNADEPRVSMTMFMGDSGLPHPDGVDPSNNKFINIVEDYANVDLEIDIPSYADFQTRFNLMTASGDMTDIVHSWLPDEAYPLARQGAFIDLKSYYDNSPQVQKYITPEMMEFAKDPVSGNYWRIPMAWDKGPQGSGVHMMRGELIDQYNNGVWPTSVEEWIEFFRVVKREVPDAIILSNSVAGDYVFGNGGGVIYYWYGALPYQWRVEDGEIIPNVLTPEFREATQVMRDLYAEGLLDKEFATNDDQTYNERVINNTVLLQVMSADNIAAGASYYKTEPTLPPHAKDVKWLFAPPLSSPPSVLRDPRYAEAKSGLPIITHGLYIPESTQDKDRAWRVIEGFASDELYEALFWGYEGEGVTYNTVDGQRVPTDKIGTGSEDYWSLHLALLFGFVDGQESKQAANLTVLGEDYHKEVYDSIEVIDQQARANGIGDLPGYAAEGDALLQAPESRLAINSFAVEAIMGRISMEEFDQRVQQWEQQFREVIYGPMQAYLDANKDELLAQGVQHIGW